MLHNNTSATTKKQMDEKTIKRFMSHVNKTEDCWLWTSSTNGRYGTFWYQGKTPRAHRLMFFIHNGYFPPEVMHTCDNPLCVNPAHLIGGTHKDNMRDAKEKGRLNNNAPKGENNGLSVLTEEAVREIRKLRKEHWSQVRLAEKFNVNQSQISRILLGKTWSHVK